ncbi:MAG: 4-diphosphocytidyl-2C-methyl-D-erythritol kinase, partial [Anaerolineae bacterium]|nr:4-diphosphocytidyl-2C-methyl-D-erythritol kinase [Anaerolineae bacterium]
MKFGAVALAEAAGKVLAHKLLAPDGKKLLSKGHMLTPADIHVLRNLGLESVIVGALAATDLDENAAARRVGEAIAGANVKVTAPGVGRANVMALLRGPLRINAAALDRINNIDEGITIATLREHTLVEKGQLLALVKIIPFGVAAARVEDVEAIAREAAPIIAVRPIQALSFGLIVSGPESARAELLSDFTEPVRERVERLGSTLDSIDYVGHTAEAIGAAIQVQRDAGRQLVI